MSFPMQPELEPTASGSQEHGIDQWVTSTPVICLLLIGASFFLLGLRHWEY